MKIHNGDHMQFEIDNANVKPEDRPDWPLPSFDARDWAKAFCKINPTFDEGMAVAWFANALMRGFDEASSRRAAPPPTIELTDQNIADCVSHWQVANGNEYQRRIHALTLGALDELQMRRRTMETKE